MEQEVSIPTHQVRYNQYQLQQIQLPLKLQMITKKYLKMDYIYDRNPQLRIMVFCYCLLVAAAAAAAAVVVVPDNILLIPVLFDKR